jgi:hypothetical protein
MGRITSTPEAIMLLARSDALVASYQFPSTLISRPKEGSTALSPCSKPGAMRVSMTG